jgi:ABC-type sulfate transport system permease subunit
LLTGFALAFARAVGEYGSVIFIAGNVPMVSEITPLLIITKLEQFDYAGATAIAVVMLVTSFILLFLINGLQIWANRSHGGGLIMSAIVSTHWTARTKRFEASAATREPRWVKVVLLIAIALTFFGLFLLLPLATVFIEALRKGWLVYLAALVEPDARSAIFLTLIVAAIAVPLNLVFGIAAAWAIAKFDFRGKHLLTTLIDLPFSVSPVVAGLIYVLIFGAQGWFGPWLIDHGVKIIFAVPGLVLATVFVTFPLSPAN